MHICKRVLATDGAGFLEPHLYEHAPKEGSYAFPFVDVGVNKICNLACTTPYFQHTHDLRYTIQANTLRIINKLGFAKHVGVRVYCALSFKTYKNLAIYHQAKGCKESVNSLTYSTGLLCKLLHTDDLPSNARPISSLLKQEFGSRSHKLNPKKV